MLPNKRFLAQIRSYYMEIFSEAFVTSLADLSAGIFTAVLKPKNSKQEVMSIKGQSIAIDPCCEL